MNIFKVLYDIKSEDTTEVKPSTCTVQGSISMLLVTAVQNKIVEQLIIIHFKIDRKLEGKKKQNLQAFSLILEK